MKRIVVIAFVLGIMFPGFAQEEVKFIFADNQSALDISSVEEVKKHYLGEEVALKLELLKSRYTYVEPASPTSPGNKTIVLKPTIYNSVL